jgi:hypothetical protein
MAMLYGVSRLLQLVGLILLPVAVAGEVAGEMALKDSLSLSTLGMLLFFAGWLLQRSAGKK